METTGQQDTRERHLDALRTVRNHRLADADAMRAFAWAQYERDVAATTKGHCEFCFEEERQA